MFALTGGRFLPQAANAWKEIDALIKDRAPHCRGVILLGLDAPADELQEGFNASAGIDVCKGFMVGRTIFGKPSKEWLANNIDDKEFVRQVSANYMELIQAWREREYSEE